MMNASNQIKLIVSTDQSYFASTHDGSMLEKDEFDNVGGLLLNTLTDALDGYCESNGSGLTSSILRALCFINAQRLQMSNKRKQLGASDEQQSSTFKEESRIMVLSTSDDYIAHYISLMNAIFTSQRMGVSIDVCRYQVVSENNQESIFMQQAAFITRGAYTQVTDPPQLLQTLISSYLTSYEVRKHMIIPLPNQVDLRATCFCHSRIVDIAYVCSVCLSVYCEQTSECATCETVYGLKRNNDLVLQ